MSLYFEMHNNPKAHFVSDITTLSDSGLDKKNPIDVLSAILYMKVREYGINANYFDVRVGSYPMNAHSGEPKIELKLPGKARLERTIFDNKFDDFIYMIQQNKDKTQYHVIKTDDADIIITYNPKQMFASGGYDSYTAMYSLTNNLVWQALENKAIQLQGTGFKGPFGIFLCDGGCSAFRTSSSPGSAFSISDVIQSFLKQHSEISFVLTFTTYHLYRRSRYSIKDNPYKTYCHIYKGKDFKELLIDIDGVVNCMLEVLPEACVDPNNAMNQLKGKQPNIGRSHYGGYKVNTGRDEIQIKISSRALLELLAGKIDQKEFFEMHRFIPSLRPSGHETNFFEIALNRGKLIKNLTIEKNDCEDDDWVVFDLQGPDPAISPFVVPKKDNDSK